MERLNLRCEVRGDESGFKLGTVDSRWIDLMRRRTSGGTRYSLYT